jgi:hypothetical protein
MAGQVVPFPARAKTLRAASRRASLTEQRVLDLQGAGFVFDSKVAGLAVRLTKGGAKSYVFQRKINGRPVRIALGKCAGMRLDAARAAVERLNGQVAVESTRAPRGRRRGAQSGS